jgi:hypothetical protein
MKREKISETIENINPKYIDEATEYTGVVKTTPKKVWYKWVAIAACFALVLAIGFPFAKDLFISPDQKDTVDAVALIEYDDSYLEVIEDAKRIKKFGLPSEITKDIIGNHIVFLQKVIPETKYSDYVVSDTMTNIELFEYKPAPYKAVRILKDGNNYYYAIFCNYLVKSNESLPVQTAFDVFGIDEPIDIISITPVKVDNTWKANGKAITDSAIISEFYTEISKLTAYSFDEYHEMTFAEKLKKYEDEGNGDIGSEAYTQVADDLREIMIETKEGLRFTIHYYPSYGWINIVQTMSYYQMSPEISEWFLNYMK